MHNLLNQFYTKANTIYPLSIELQEALTHKSEVITYTKKEQIIVEDKPVQYAYLILDGILRSAYTTADGKDITSNFITAGDFIISLVSFYNNTVSLTTVDCITDVVVARISFTDLQQLFITYMELNYLARVLAHQYIIQADTRLMLLRKMSAKDKWNYFVQNYGHIVQQAPLGTIASYLGINQETLSRIRKEK